MKRILRLVVRVIGWPLRILFRDWFNSLILRIDESEHATAQRLTETGWSVGEIVARETNVVQGEVQRKIDEVETRLNAQIESLRRAAAATSETIAELSRASVRAAERATDGLTDLRNLLEPSAQAQVLWPLVGRSIEDLPESAAHLVNWANSAIGMAGEGGVFVNNGLNLQFHAGGARVVEVSERIVELPFASGVAAQLPTGSRVLDVGARESSLALELASLGHHTVALDPRGYPFAHANLEVVTKPAEDWDGPEEPFDAIFCVSTIEHLGLGAYVPPSGIDDLDVVVMAKLRDWLGPDGRCVLTVPYGHWSVDDFQRVYDAPHLRRLVEGWRVERQGLYHRVDACAWEPLPADVGWPDPVPGVAMLELRPDR